MKLAWSLAVFAAVVAAQSSANDQDAFLAWAKQHSVVIPAAEMFVRFATWQANLAKIEAHNAGNHTFTLAMNKFGAMTAEEFKDTMTGRKRAKPHREMVSLFNGTKTTDVADVDWRAKGAVTPVQDQGSCGSCWTFSTCGALEGATFVKSGHLTKLSEQQLMDCDTDFNEGCDGGLEIYAYEDYVEPNKGLCKWDDYPYAGEQGACKDSSCTPVSPISGFTEVAPGEDNLEAALLMHPVAVGVEAHDSVWQFYAKGVATTACGTSIDHGVTAVGFGVEGDNAYWLIKNSWGTEWGEDGFIRLGKASGSTTYNKKKGQCGVAAEVCFPIPK